MAKKVPLIAHKVENHEPDRPEGFTENKLKELLNSSEFDDFKLWMRGQAIKVEAGEAIYYAHDVMRWAHGHDRWRTKMPKTQSHG